MYSVELGIDEENNTPYSQSPTTRRFEIIRDDKIIYNADPVFDLNAIFACHNPINFH